MLDSLLKINEMDVVLLPEELASHLGVPFAGLVSEVDASFDEFSNEFVRHVFESVLFAGYRRVFEKPHRKSEASQARLAARLSLLSK